MMNDAEAGRLSAAARAALASAAPHPGGITRWFTCSVSVARELLLWCENGKDVFTAMGIGAVLGSCFSRLAHELGTISWY